MPIKPPVKFLIFDWGDTIMRDYNLPGPMSGWPKVDYIPGAEEALKALSEKYTTVIATSADHSGTEEMISALKRVDADKYFNHFFSSKELGHKKPDPEFFRAIIQKLGTNASQAVMIGNLYEKDIIGAKAAGLQTILFDEKMQSQDFPDADILIHNMGKLIQIFP
jgi:HAD superfamily hydrolase (TIGR01509 family)